MDRYLSIEAFVTAAETENFSEAARRLNVSKSVVTTRIQQLESYVGAPLFHRNTRNIQLSEVGEAFLADCTDLLSRTSDLVDQMRQARGTIAGRLRVHALPGLVLGHLASYLREFQDLYPGVELDLVVNDTVVDPVKAGVDCTLQIFKPASNELIGRPLFPVRRVFCASPEYLERHGTPKGPRNLYEHRLGLYSNYPTRDRWLFYGKRETVSLDLRPALRTNSVHLLEEYAAANAGIVCIPTLVASASIMSGRLVPVLADWQLSSFWLWVVYPHTHRGGLRLKLFIEHILSRFSTEPPWDADLIQAGHIAQSLIE